MSERFDFIPETLVRTKRGFDPEYDIFGYKEFGDSIISVLSSKNNSLNLAIHGDWGCGKTTFIQMWKEYVEDDGFPVIYFDAFKHDYLSDVFSALTEEIYTFADEKLSPDKKNYLNDYLSKVKESFCYIVKKSILKGINTSTGGFVNEKTFKEIEAIWLSRFENDNFKKEKEIFKNFKKALSNLMDQISNEKPLIFIIDELDRCRPDFALEILEKIKHVFNAEGVHFVFVVNFESLRTSVKHTYGTDKRYLQKFFNFIFDLPTDNSLYIYIRKFYNFHYCLNKILPDITKHKKIQKQKFEIRDFQKLINYFKAVIEQIPEPKNVDVCMIQLLEIYSLKIVHPDQFNHIIDMINIGDLNSLRSYLMANEEDINKKFNYSSDYFQDSNSFLISHGKILFNLVKNSDIFID